MSSIAIRVENLGKRYRIGVRRHNTLRDAIAAAFRRRPLTADHSPETPGLRSPVSGLQSEAGLQSPVSRLPSSAHIWALRGVSFEIKRGEVVGIIGRNGAGKSTLLKILSRITEPTEGFAEIHGRVGSLLEVGTGFHPELTGRENIFLNGAILGMRRAEIRRKFDEIVAFAEVERFVDTPVKHYSSGMYVRLAFAVAAHLQPEILLVDEVLAVGDAVFQRKCLGKMGDVAKEGRTVLFVSHNMFSLQNLCCRGIFLEAGRKALAGSITEVITRYMDIGKEQSGVVSWASPEVAPGDDRARLSAVRVVADDAVTGEVDIEKEFHVEVDYWNLESNGRRMVSIHLYNALGVCVFTSANLPSVSLAPDPWSLRAYPRGLFRTTCTVPGCLLNEGTYNISVFLNSQNVADHIVALRDVLRFTVLDTGGMRKEYTGPWLGTIRPRLAWQTAQLS